MKRIYKFTPYELSIVPECAYIIRKIHNYSENFNIIPQLQNRLEQIIFSPQGMYLVGILYNLTFDDELYAEVPNEYEEDVRYLISGRGTYLSHFKGCIEPYLQFPINKSNISYINYLVYMYNTFYKDKLSSFEFIWNKGNNEARKINKLHEISKEELCKKYKRYYNEQGEYLLAGKLVF